MVSGGKDSFYAIMSVGKVDIGLMLVYEFPRPSPHLINLGKSVETLLNAGIPVIVKAVKKGFERVETIDILKRIGAKEIVAGDVYIDEHLKYLESIANDVGAKLIEPLWGMDPEELLYKEIESGIETLVIGVDKRIEQWLVVEINKSNVKEFAESCKKVGVDPLGERGEYHTLVINSPLHRKRLQYKRVEDVEYKDYKITIVI